MELQEIILAIQETEPTHLLTHPATVEQLAQCEGEIGLRIPECYRRFLSFTNGAILYETEELLGTSRFWDHAEIIQEAYLRLKQAPVSLPATLLPFYSSGGQYFCFETGAGNAKPVPVVEWYEHSGRGKCRYESFEDWFYHVIYLEFHARYAN